MTFTSYDSVDANQIPPDATHSSYYANGWPANLHAVEAQCPNAKLIPVCIVRGQLPASLKQIVHWQNGVAIDIEDTDWIPSDAGGYARRAISEGVTPVLYCTLSSAPAVVASVHAAGVQRHQFKLHTAHWTFVPHICSGIATVMGTLTADATQYTDKALGRNLDASLCQDDYFGKPKPPPKQAHPSGQARAELIVDWDKPVGHRLSVSGSHGTWVQGTEQQLEVMQVSFAKSGVWKVAGVPKDTKPLGS